MSKIIKEALSELTPENLPKTLNALASCINAMLLERKNSYCGIKIAFDLVLDNTVTKNGDSLAYSFS